MSAEMAALENAWAVLRGRTGWAADGRERHAFLRGALAALEARAESLREVQATLGEAAS